MKFDLMATAHMTTSHEVVPAVKMFDNLAFIGTIGTNCLLIETSEGLILLDAMWPGQFYEDLIEDGIRSLGYDPADIKILLISHGHPDHSGCGKHFIDKYGAVPYMSKVDYDFEIEFCKKANNPDWTFDFEVDHFLDEGDVLTLGDTNIYCYSTPGHTPGGLSFVIPVKDQGRDHVAALWGGSAPPPVLEANYQYIRSLDHFIEACKKHHVDADLMNHPILNNGVERLAVLRNRLDQVANPFVIGEEGYIRYTELFRILAEDNIKNGVIDFTKKETLSGNK
ncbi:MAG: MBL fold metallo-hydrolase [Clostridia bacterium]|nr:MBL fold metallo-hydrolase [Clostridia bacterium]